MNKPKERIEDFLKREMERATQEIIEEIENEEDPDWLDAEIEEMENAKTPEERTRIIKKYHPNMVTDDGAFRLG